MGHVPASLDHWIFEILSPTDATDLTQADAGPLYVPGDRLAERENHDDD